MMKQRKTVSVFTVALIAISAMSGAFYVKGQTPQASAELVKLAEGASQQVKNLIDSIFANETSLQKIENSSLLDQLSGRKPRTNLKAQTMQNPPLLRTRHWACLESR
jgi:hypothetical protein